MVSRLAFGLCILSWNPFLLPGQTKPQRPAPTVEKQNEVIETVRDHVLRYTQPASHPPVTLVKRHYSATPLSGWQLQSVERTSDASVTIGEFRNILREPFDRVTMTSFKWDHWGTLRGRLSYVFAYAVERSRSGWYLSQDLPGIARAYDGRVYIDADRFIVLRITRRTVDVPATSKVEDASIILDFSLNGGVASPLLLPFRADEEVRSESLSRRTVIEVYTRPAYLKPATDIALASSNHNER